MRKMYETSSKYLFYTIILPFQYQCFGNFFQRGGNFKSQETNRKFAATFTKIGKGTRTGKYEERKSKNRLGIKWGWSKGLCPSFFVTIFRKKIGRAHV